MADGFCIDLSLLLAGSVRAMQLLKNRRNVRHNGNGWSSVCYMQMVSVSHQRWYEPVRYTYPARRILVVA